jgi:galactokinase
MVKTDILAKLGPFLSDQTILVRSPGRINLIGEHTDYNEGFVLPAAIDKAAYIAMTPRTDEEIHLFAIDLQAYFKTTISEIQISNLSWPNYILGVVEEFKKSGAPLKGFDAALTSDIPSGAGLSSSAAVECATAMALNEYLKTSFERFTLVSMAQKAEHEFAGVQCGIMDQFASMFGKKNQVIKLDCRSLAYEYLPINLEGVAILLLDTGIKHALASTEYNTRRRQCEEGISIIRAHLPGIKSLRDVSLEMLDNFVAKKNPLVYRRCRYVVEENQRLLQACLELQKGDLSAFGRHMFASHAGLSKLYEVSCKELDYLVEQVKNNKGVLGARMMGGGFGGCTINLVRGECVETIITQIADNYFGYSGIKLKPYIAGIENGTSVIPGSAKSALITNPS